MERYEGQRKPDEYTPDEEALRENPDLLMESEGIFYRPGLTDNQRLMLHAIAKAPLTEEQRLIVHLCGDEMLSINEAAKRLKIAKGTAQEHLESARVKIQQTYQNILDTLTKRGF